MVSVRGGWYASMSLMQSSESWPALIKVVGSRSLKRVGSSMSRSVGSGSRRHAALRRIRRAIGGSKRERAAVNEISFEELIESGIVIELEGGLGYEWNRGAERRFARPYSSYRPRNWLVPSNGAARPGFKPIDAHWMLLRRERSRVPLATGALLGAIALSGALTTAFDFDAGTKAAYQPRAVTLPVAAEAQSSQSAPLPEAGGAAPTAAVQASGARAPVETAVAPAAQAVSEETSPGGEQIAAAPPSVAERKPAAAGTEAPSAMQAPPATDALPPTDAPRPVKTVVVLADGSILKPSALDGPSDIAALRMSPVPHAPASSLPSARATTGGAEPQAGGPVADGPAAGVPAAGEAGEEETAAIPLPLRKPEDYVAPQTTRRVARSARSSAKRTKDERPLWQSFVFNQDRR